MGCSSSKESDIRDARAFLKAHDKVCCLDLGFFDFIKYTNATETLARYNIPYRHKGNEGYCRPSRRRKVRLKK